jgi:histone acetyltransferase (RNA polymerase elongator complex component)
MNECFSIRHANGRTMAAVPGLAPGSYIPPRPFIIPVFIPLSGCPHRCSFCNQSAITGVAPYRLSAAAVEQTVRTWRPRVRDSNRPVEIAFYGGNFLGLPTGLVQDLLTAAAGFVHRGAAGGIRFSTRPDTISPETLAVVHNFPVVAIELGLQSMDDRVLGRNRRGHTAASTTAAARRIKSAGYALGLQMMTGLPGDTKEGAEQTAETMIRLAPDTVRIYPTLVLANSPLARQFRKGDFIPMGLEETITLVSRLLMRFVSTGIPVIRLGLQAEETLSSADTVLAGPYHPALGELVYSRIFLNLAAAALARHPDRHRPVRLRVHPRHLSRMMGAGRHNLRCLQTRFQNPSLSIQPDEGITPHHLEVDNTPAPIASRSCGP